MARKLRQLRLSIDAEGLLNTLYWAGYGYLRPNRFLVLARDLTAGGDPPADRPGVGLELWHRDQVRAWRAGRRDVPVEFRRDEIDGVYTCSVAIVDGDLAGLIWIYRPEHDSRVFRLAPGETELNHGVVRPEYRERRLFQSILSYACLRLREEGIRSVFAAVHSRNDRSHRAFLNAGFRDVGAVRHFLLYRPRIRGCPAAAVALRSTAPTSSAC